MASHDVRFGGSGIPQTVLPAEPEDLLAALAAAASMPAAERHDEVSRIVASSPRSLGAWAAKGDIARDTIEAYSSFRVGYHRGLDALRQNGWRGSGYVRWSEPTNQAFLRCLDGLRAMAEEIGETDEAERCALFLRQLDPDWPPAGR
ncbi:MAG: DUF3151 family protein [Acidimicrobiales bacterium]|nr:DUF3151 family protein [Acidimicrobiales bacterium]